MLKTAPVAIVIPNLNGERLIRPCLQSLLEQTYKKAQVVVVDNGSTDRSVKLIEREFPKVTLIKLDKNYGFAGGVNRGIEWALARRCRYVALLNNDAVAAPDWLENLVKTMEKNPKVGIVTGKLLQDKKPYRIDSTGDLFSIWGIPYPRGRGELDRGQYDTPEPVMAASGGASLYRSVLLKKIGLFDEDFFAYFEDVDISLRAQLAGWQIRYQPTAVAYHRLGATSSRFSGFGEYQMLKNADFLYLKNMPGRLFWKYLWRFVLIKSLIMAGSLKRRQFAPLVKATAVSVLKLPKMLLKRRSIQRSRKVGLDYFDAMLLHELPKNQKTLLKIRAFLRRKP